MMDVTFGGLTRAVEFAILDETLNIPCGIFGLQFLVDVTLDCNDKCVPVLNKTVPLQFFKIPEKVSKQFSSALEVKRRINRLEVTVTNNKLLKNFWILISGCAAQIAQNNSAPLPHYGGMRRVRTLFIYSDLLKCVR